MSVTLLLRILQYLDKRTKKFKTSCQMGQKENLQEEKDPKMRYGEDGSKMDTSG